MASEHDCLVDGECGWLYLSSHGHFALNCHNSLINIKLYKTEIKKDNLN